MLTIQEPPKECFLEDCLYEATCHTGANSIHWLVAGCRDNECRMMPQSWCQSPSSSSVEVIRMCHGSHKDARSMTSGGAVGSPSESLLGRDFSGLLEDHVKDLEPGDACCWPSSAMHRECAVPEEALVGGREPMPPPIYCSPFCSMEKKHQACGITGSYWYLWGIVQAHPRLAKKCYCGVCRGSSSSDNPRHGSKALRLCDHPAAWLPSPLFGILNEKMWP